MRRSNGKTKQLLKPKELTISRRQIFYPKDYEEFEKNRKDASTYTGPCAHLNHNSKPDPNTKWGLEVYRCIEIKDFLKSKNFNWNSTKVCWYKIVKSDEDVKAILKEIKFKEY